MPYMLPLPSMQEVPHQSSKPQQNHHPHQLMRTVSISILVMSLPVLYVSFLHVPPAALVRDTTFWFLMSNSIIIVIAADSGMLFFGSSSSSSSVDVSAGGLPPLDDVARGEAAAGSRNEVAVVPRVGSQVMVVREAAEHQEGASATMMVAESDAYALVPRDDDQPGRHRSASGEPPADECRDIMVVTPPPPPPSALLPAGGAPVWNDHGGGLVQLKASKSLAREEEEQRLRRRRRHGHRASPSTQYSRALVPVPQDKSVVLVAEEEKPQQLLRRAATTTEARSVAAEEESERDQSEYSRLSDEELNRRVEEFIAKFNREMRMQLEREQLALAAA